MTRLPIPFLLALAACAPQPGPQAAPPAPVAQGPCDATALAPLLGKARSESMAKQALRLSGAKTLRWIAPGMAVTMDYRTDRLNLEVDENGILTRARCG